MNSALVLSMCELMVQHDGTAGLRPSPCPGGAKMFSGSCVQPDHLAPADRRSAPASRAALSRPNSLPRVPSPGARRPARRSAISARGEPAARHELAALNSPDTGRPRRRSARRLRARRRRTRCAPGICAQIAAYAISGSVAMRSASSLAQVGADAHALRQRVRIQRRLREHLHRRRTSSGPRSRSCVTICSRMPFTIAAIAITVATPITTPRIVSAERSLLVRSASNAMPMFSRS